MHVQQPYPEEEESITHQYHDGQLNTDARPVTSNLTL